MTCVRVCVRVGMRVWLYVRSGMLVVCMCVRVYAHACVLGCLCLCGARDQVE